jgi:hypothetical protein
MLDDMGMRGYYTLPGHGAGGITITFTVPTN